MKKLEKIDLSKCELLSNYHLGRLIGSASDGKTIQSVCTQSTSCCPNNTSDTFTSITYDDGTVAGDTICDPPPA